MTLGKAFGWGIVVLLCLVGRIPFAYAASTGKVALVIGNAKYAEVAALKNPENDAVDMAAALSEIGFDVTVKLNADIETFDDALGEFQQKAEGSEVAVIFYAGHGIEFENRNYLLPVDAALEKESQIRYKTLELERLEEAVSGASKLRMVFLDACRNNPFADRIQARGGKSRSVIGRGLAKVEPIDGTVIAYSAKGGTTASDGDGRNSPYTAALLKYVRQPDLDVDRMLRMVRDDVLKATNREQEPFDYGSLPAETISLNAKDVSAIPAAKTSSDNTTMAAPLNNAAKEAWDAVKDSKLRSDFETIIRLFPTTFYATLAQNRIAEIDKQTPSQPGDTLASTGTENSPTQINIPVGEPQSWFLALYPNIDFYGGDLVPTGLKAETPEQCAQFCGNDAACKMFTYNTRAGMCFLKSGYEVAQRATEAIGGVFYKGTRNEQRVVRAEWEFMVSADIQAYDIGSTRDIDYSSCFATCRSTNECQGVSFVGKLKRDKCWLKGGNVSTAFAKKGVVSARRIDLTVAPVAVIPVSAKD
ncbi:UNVERIFIED_ORG: caspase family protein [Roseateles sp. XES5]|nr:caspase family protein [Roseateles sp. XES5]